MKRAFKSFYELWDGELSPTCSTLNLNVSQHFTHYDNSFWDGKPSLRDTRALIGLMVSNFGGQDTLLLFELLEELRACISTNIQAVVGIHEFQVDGLGTGRSKHHSNQNDIYRRLKPPCGNV